MKRSAVKFFVAGVALLATIAVALGQEQSRDLFLARSSTPPGLPVYTGSHALIIGINKYPNLPNKNLNFAVNDAQEFAKVLTDSYGFKASDVKILTDGDATLANIRAAITDLANPGNIHADDRILIYFSGHGQTVKDQSGNDLGFLIPSDGKVDLDRPKLNDFKQTCLPMQFVWDTLDPSPAKHIAVIADACFSGLLTKSKGLGANELSGYLTRTARQVVSAGGKGEETWESPEYGHGVFTYNLIQELKKRAQTSSIFTMEELFASIQTPVMEMSKSRQVPQFRNVLDTEGQMLFFPTGGNAVVADDTDKPDDHAQPIVTTATLVIHTKPDGAQVTIDGADGGTTPLTKTIPILDKNSVHVKVALDGYETSEQDVQLSAKRDTKVDFKLKKVKASPTKSKTARLSITSDPPGATVFIDRVPKGTTPYTLEVDTKRPVSMKVKVSLAGYDSAEQSATVDPATDGSVNLSLTKTAAPITTPPLVLTQIGTINADSPAQEIKFSPDGKQLAVKEARLSADGGRIAAENYNIIDIASGQLAKHEEEDKNSYVRLSDDWKHLIFISLLQNGSKSWASILVEDADTGSSGRVLSADMGRCTGLNYAWSDGKTVIICGRSPDGNAAIAIVRVGSGRSDTFITPGVITQAVASADGSVVAAFREGLPGQPVAVNLVLMKGSKHTDQNQIPISDSDAGLQLSMAPDGNAVALRTGRRLGNGSVQIKGLRVYDARSGAMRFQSSPVKDLMFAKDGSRLLGWTTLDGGSIEMFDAMSGNSLGTQKSPQIWLSSDGKLAATQDPTTHVITVSNVQILK